MKKIFLSALALLGMGAIGTEAEAQFSVYDKEGKVLFTMPETPAYVDFTYNKPIKGTTNGHEWVDMGLSVKWSSVNVGASNPQDAGNYYAWGETETKESYEWSTYTAETAQFKGDNKTTLEVADDAAAANWQGGWVMPTQADWEELVNSCYMVWATTYNSKSVNGWIVYKAKKDADKGQKVYSGSTPSSDYDVSSGAHIFLPAAGCRRGSDLVGGGSDGIYWSASLFERGSDGSRSVYFTLDYLSTGGYGHRYFGQSVRPVCPAPEFTNGHDAVDLGLPSGKLWATCNVGASAPEESGDHIAWGETAAKSDYSWSTYKYMQSGISEWYGCNKYQVNDRQFDGVWYTNVKYYNNGGKTVLEASDDVASQSWGGEWRMPTIDEWQELYNNTTREWTDDYKGTGVKGYILTSTKKGYTDVSIFLPAAGYRNGSNLVGEGSDGYYWASSLYEDDSSYGRYVGFYSGDFSGRYLGQSVRPVCPAQK